MIESCAACRYFKLMPDNKEVLGFCRYNPPRPGHASRDGARDKMRIFSEWPAVFGDDWCGKFHSKETAPAA